MGLEVEAEPSPGEPSRRIARLKLAQANGPEEAIVSMASDAVRDAQIRELSASETDVVAGAREFGECSDTVYNLGLFYIKVTTCCDGTAVRVGW